VRKVVELAAVVLGSAVLALVVGIILAGVSASGVIAMELTHALFWVTFAITGIGSTIGLVLLFREVSYAIIGGLCTALLVVGGLFWLDGLKLGYERWSWVALFRPQHIYVCA